LNLVGHTGSAKKYIYIHNLTKENCMFYVSTKFNYTSQVEYKLQYSTIQVTIQHNTRHNTAQYKLQ